MSLGNHFGAENLGIADHEENISQGGDNQVDDVFVQRKVRGPTRMREIWVAEDRLKVELNEVGQPIDEKTPAGKKIKAVSKMTHFMGSIIKMGNHAKVYQQWNDVSEIDKMDMVDLVKEKFDIPPGCEPWLLQSFAKKLRNYRADLKRKYYNAMHTKTQKRKNRPPKFPKKSWRKLIRYWDSEDAQKVSDRNKDNRKLKNMTQSTGKKSFARCAEELREELGREPTRVERFRKCYSKKDGTPSNDNSAQVMAKMSAEIAQLPDGEDDKVGPDDIFAKVMGKDKDGRARMFGLGVSTSDLWSQIPSRSKSYRVSATLQGTMKEMQETLKDQSRKIAELESKLNQKEGNEVSGSSVPSAATYHSTPHTTSTHESRTLRVGSSVYLKSIVNPSVTIARGRIHSLNPLDEVAGEELGPNWCEVHIEVPIKRGEHLIRPYSFFKMIEDAVGATIAWPCPFTELVGVDDDW